MSMNGYIRRISSEEAVKLESKPASITRLIRKRGYDMKAMIRDQLQGKTSSRRQAMEAAYQSSVQISNEIKRSERKTLGPTPEELRKIMQPLEDAGAFGKDPDLLELDKSWHMIHFLLAGSVEAVDSALGRAILGGKEIGPDIGYGPARLLSTSEVQETASALALAHGEDLARRADLDKATTVYGGGDQEDLEIALDYFPRLQQFYAESAARGNAIILFIR